MQIKNARIDKVKLFIEDHDILTFMISLDLGDVGCGVGGYALDQAFEDDNGWIVRKSSPAGLDCMRRIMEVVGVNSWEDLEGKYVRYEYTEWGCSINKIGNIIKDDWIDIKEFFKNYDYEDWYKKFRK